MGARAASPRVLVLAGVAALHALVLLLLVTATRPRLVPGITAAVPLIVMFLEPRVPPGPTASGHAPRERSLHNSPPAEPLIEVPTAPAAPEAGTAIDWTAEASASANDQLVADALHARQANALAPPKSALFAAPAKGHGFQWDYARTHREGVPGIATVIHLGDRCAVAFFLIIPVAGGCAAEKPQARSDLFDHMHDSQP
jgi:hypothetical protein